MPLTFHELVAGLRSLKIDRDRPVLAHASLSAFGGVRGGGETLLGAMLSVYNHLMMPVFTYRTMVIPETGPEGNALIYGSGQAANRMAEFFHRDLPADALVGIVSELLRRHPWAKRSSHPILSFAAVGMEEILKSQTLQDPLAPIRLMLKQGGWVILLGVDQTANTSIHYAEKQAGRKQFVRWALTPQGVRECPAFPGCSNGFKAIEPLLDEVSREVVIGDARIQAIPMDELICTAEVLIAEDPLALLCDRPDCELCTAVRESQGGR